MTAGEVYKDFLARVELSRGRTITREQLEAIIRVRELPSSSLVALPNSDNLVSYAEHLQKWLVGYQEGVACWGGVYTPLRTRQLSLHVGLLGLSFKGNERGPEDILDVIRRHRKVVLVGEPGSGKTTTALKIAYDQAERLKADPSLPIPVVILLRELSHGVNVTTLVQSSLARHGLSFDLVSVEQLVNSTDHLYLILEGINEIGRAARETDVLANLARVVNTTQGGVLLTTRREGYDPQLFQGSETVEILPLARNDIEAFLKKHSPDVAQSLLDELELAAPEASRHTGSLLEFVSNPLLLMMLVAIYRDGTKLPSNRGELLERFTTYIVSQESQKGSKYSTETRQMILESVAANMLRQGQLVSLDYTSMNILIARVLNELGAKRQVSPDVTVTDVMGEIDRRVFRFLRSTPDKQVVQWEHHLFQEYYAASWLRGAFIGADGPYGRQTILHDVINPDWTEPLRMLVGKLHDNHAIEMIKILLNINPLIGAASFAAARPTIQDNTRQNLVIALEGVLDSTDLDLRREAVKALGQLGQLGIPSLFFALGDEDSRVRRDAACGLDRIKPGRLDELDLMNRREIRRRVAERGQYLDYIDNDNDPVVRRWGVWLLSEMLDSHILPEAMQVQSRQILEAAVDSSDSFTKLAAARAMAHFGSSGLAVLAELALVDRGNVGKLAGLAFEKLSSSRGVDILVQFAASHSDDFVRERAQQNLATYGEGVAQSVLKSLDRAFEENDGRAAMGLVAALGFIGGEMAFKRLIQLLDLSKPELCACAAEALGHTHNPEAVTPLLDLLRRQDLPFKQRCVWHGAAKGLMTLGEMALPDVATFAHEELAEPTVVDLVLDILANAKAQGIGTLMTLIERDQTQIRAGAVTRLGWLRVKEVKEKLYLLLMDTNAEVRVATVGALHSIEGDSSVPAILPLLNDPSIDVCEQVAQILMQEYRQEGVLQVLVEQLANPVVTPYARQALLSAGENGVPLLLEQLGNSTNQAQVRQILTEIGAANVAPLTAILLTPQDNRRLNALITLAEIPFSDAAPLFKSLLRDSSPDIRAKALESLLGLLDKFELETIIVDMMDDVSARVREVAIRAVGDHATLPVARALVGRLGDRDDKVRQATVATLGEVGHLVVNELMDMASGRGSEIARIGARDVLLKVDKLALPALLELLETTRRPKVISLVGDILHEIGSPAFVALIPLLDSEVDRVCRYSSQILAYDMELAVHAILLHLHKNELSNGAQAFLYSHSSQAVKLLVDELGKLSEEDVESIALIRSLLVHLYENDRSIDLTRIMLSRSKNVIRREIFQILRDAGHLNFQRVRRAARTSPSPRCDYALEILGWLGTPESLMIVSEALTPSRPVDTRRIACQILAESKSVSYLSILVEALGDPDEKVRQLAVGSLGQLGDVRTIEPLNKIVQDPSPAVRLEAVGSLEMIGGLVTYEPLKLFVQDKDHDVAQAAVSALGKLSHPDTIPLLLGIASDEEYFYLIRLTAAQVLGQQDRDAVEKLLPNYWADSEKLNSMDLKILGHIGSAATTLILSTMPTFLDKKVLPILDTLKLIGDTQSQEAVVDLANQCSQAIAPWEIVVAVCETLGSVGDEKAISVLNQLQRNSWRWKQGQDIVKAAAAAKECIEQRVEREP